MREKKRQREGGWEREREWGGGEKEKDRGRWEIEREGGDRGCVFLLTERELAGRKDSASCYYQLYIYICSWE